MSDARLAAWRQSDLRLALTPWRAADSLALRRFLHLGLEDATPDHSTISQTRRLIETHRAVLAWVQAQLVAQPAAREKGAMAVADGLGCQMRKRSFTRNAGASTAGRGLALLRRRAGRNCAGIRTSSSGCWCIPAASAS